MRGFSILSLLVVLGVTSILSRPWYAGALPESQNDAVLAVIPVGSLPSGVGVDPTTNRVYVPNFGTGDVSVIDGVSNTVIATIPVGPSPGSVGVNPVTNRIYVTDVLGTIWVIDGATNTVIDSYSGISGESYGVAVNSVTNRIYVSDFFSGEVSVIDGGSDEVMATFTVGIPYEVAVNPKTNRIYVADATSGVGASNISVFDSGSNTVITKIPMPDGAAPFGVAVNTVTNRVYSTYFTGATAWVIDGATSEIVTTIEGLATPNGTSGHYVAVNTVTNRIYIASTAVSAIDGASNAVISALPLDGDASGVGVNASTNRIYVSLSQGGVVVLDGAKLAEAAAGGLPPTGSPPGPTGSSQQLLLVTAGAAALALSALGVVVALRKTPG